MRVWPINHVLTETLFVFSIVDFFYSQNCSRQCKYFPSLLYEKNTPPCYPMQTQLTNSKFLYEKEVIRQLIKTIF